MPHHATILGARDLANILDILLLLGENSKNASKEIFLQTYLMASASRQWEKSHDQLRKEKIKNRCHHQSSTASCQKVTSKKA